LLTEPKAISYTFILLFDQEEAEECHNLMLRGKNSDCDIPTFITVPEVSGVEFFSTDPDVLEEVNTWWEDNIFFDARPVFLAVHEEGLDKWIAGLDGDFFIGVPNEELQKHYADLRPDIKTIVSMDPAEITEFAMQTFLSEDVVESVFKTEFRFKNWWLQTPPPEITEIRSTRISRDEDNDEDEEDDEENEADDEDDESSISEEEFRSYIQEQLKKREQSAGEPSRTSESRREIAGREQGPRPFVRAPRDRVQPGRRPRRPVDDDDDDEDDEMPEFIRNLRGEDREKAMRDYAEGIEEDEKPEPVPPPDSAFAHLARAAIPSAPIYKPEAQPPQETQSRNTPKVQKGKNKSQTPKRSLGDMVQPIFQKLRVGKNKNVGVPSELAYGIQHKKPLIIAVGSRKGGVGKTASAAGLAVVFGISINQATRGKVALIDGNIGNPAAWGDLKVPATSATVQSCIEALNHSEEPPLPAFANTPGLACYREDRDHSAAYAAIEIQQFCSYLSPRYDVIIIDLPNRLPDPQSAEGQVTMHWLDLANVLVIPTDANPEGMLSVMEYLDEVDKMADDKEDDRPPIVVPFIAPQTREVRKDPGLIHALEQIEQRGAQVVWIPRDEKAVLALWTERSIADVSPTLRDAYVSLAGAIVNAIQ
jgi:cellulose biosynthesis protein BcsQ